MPPTTFNKGLPFDVVNHNTMARNVNTPKSTLRATNVLNGLRSHTALVPAIAERKNNKQQVCGEKKLETEC